MPRPPGHGPGFEVRRQKPDGRWDAAYLSRAYCGTLLRGFGAPAAALPDVEEAAAAFKRERPDLPLDPEAEWRPFAVAS